MLMGAMSVRCCDGPWTLAVEINGFAGTLGKLMAPASAGTRIVSHFTNMKGHRLSSWWEDGELRTRFEWPHNRSGSTPDALVDAMARAGFDLDDDEQAGPGIPENLALAEQLTGVRVTAELLDNATHGAGIVQLPPSTTRPIAIFAPSFGA